MQLFARSTRSLRLTQQGELFLEQCRPGLEALQQAHQQLAAGEQALRGALQLSAPSDFGRNVLLRWLDEFQNQHPHVTIRLQLSDRMANLFSDPVDAAFRYGTPPDSNLVWLPLAPANRRVLRAAPSYLVKHGAPATPHDLAKHACLCFMFGDDVRDRWRFARDGGVEFTERVRGTNVSDDGDAVRRWALLGKGIAYNSRLDLFDDLRHGRLRALCPEWTTEAAPLFLILPTRRQLSPLLRCLRDFITQCIERLGLSPQDAHDSRSSTGRKGAATRRKARTR